VYIWRNLAAAPVERVAYVSFEWEAIGIAKLPELLKRPQRKAPVALETTEAKFVQQGVSAPHVTIPAEGSSEVNDSQATTHNEKAPASVGALLGLSKLWL